MMDEKHYEDLIGLDIAATVDRRFWTAVARGNDKSFSFQGLVDDRDTLNVSVRVYPTQKYPIVVNVGSFDETKFRTTWLMSVEQAEELVGHLNTALIKAKLSGPAEGSA
jgi:hypothetical protein